MSGLRARWAAVGAACAVALGAGGFGVVQAVVSSGNRSVYVPISPVRVLDTRSSTEISNDTRRLVVEGVITTTDGVSRQVVPVDASAVAVNITATGTRKNGDYGYVSAFPCSSDSETVPNASSLNFETGVDIANALNVTTSANGSICLYVYGTADLIVDVAGYFVDHDHDDRYYTEAEVDAALSTKVSEIELDSAIADVVREPEMFPVIVPGPRNRAPIAVLPGDAPTGTDVAMAVDAEGFPVVAAYDATTDSLELRVCTNATCRSGFDNTVDASGRRPAVALSADGHPVVVYQRVEATSPTYDLWVAVCGDPECTFLSGRTVLDGDGAGTGESGLSPSVAFGTSGFPLIAYGHSPTGGVSQQLRLAVCGDPTCQSPVVRTLETINGGGAFYTSIAIGPGGKPVIAYFDDVSEDLRLLTCADASCSSSSSVVVDGDGAGPVATGRHASLTIGPNGFPIISYFDDTTEAVKVAACTNASCTTSIRTTIDQVGNGPVAKTTAIDIGFDGLPVVAYFHVEDQSVRVAACANAACTISTTSQVDSPATGPLAMKIGRYGRPLVAYQAEVDVNDLELWMAELYPLDDFRAGEAGVCASTSTMVC